MNVTYFGALIAGLLSFLSPCVLPLVPPYLCFLGGATFDQLAGEDETPRHVYVTIVLSSVAFVLGFTTVFVALGATATAMGQLLIANFSLLSKIAGVIIIVAGLHFLGLFHIPLLHREARYHAETRPAGLLGAYLIGLAFAFGWTPCIGPMLGAILTLSAGTASLSKGMMLLAVYAAGLGVPFLVSAVFTDALARRIRTVGRLGRSLQMLAGAIMVIMGGAMMAGELTSFSYWLLATFRILAKIG